MSSVSGLQFSGHVLSVRETSDDLVGSCNGLANDSVNLGSFKEITISTGKEHGAFYLPRPEWLDPVLNWIEYGTAIGEK